jgi:hypothetical protein
MKTKLLLLTAIALGLFASFAASGTPQNLVLILDASNSMNKPFASDTRIAAARSALDNLLTRMPEQGNVGLMAFGHRINYQNEVESCQDITFLFPLAPYTVAIGQQMIGAVAQVKPQGKTPLADALTVAANSLAGLGQGGTIVLLSDGEGNCGGQEAVVAQMLATMQPPIVLHVIGLDVDAQASESLRAMALETGGSYWDVSDSASLADALFAAISTAPAEAAATPAAADGIPPEYAALAARLGFKIDNVVYGTESDDVIYGTPGNDLIFGLGGNDFIISLGGNDILVGGPGRDILEGGEGNDVLMGGEGDDLLFGGGGDDIVCGGPGNDSLEGEAGNDILDRPEPALLRGWTRHAVPRHRRLWHVWGVRRWMHPAMSGVRASSVRSPGGSRLPDRRTRAAGHPPLQDADRRQGGERGRIDPASRDGVRLRLQHPLYPLASLGGHVRQPDVARPGLHGSHALGVQ